jgi:hypothetical protein
LELIVGKGKINAWPWGSKIVCTMKTIMTKNTNEEGVQRRYAMAKAHLT